MSLHLYPEMKKLLICFSLFVFHSSLCHAQDTIVLRDGQKMSVKIVSVNDFVIYTIPPGDKLLYFRRKKVRRIKYSDGVTYTINDTVRPNWKPYILVSGGASLPTFNGYGGEQFSYNVENDYPPLTSGYAKNGSIFSITGGINFSPKWEITGMFSNIRNKFDAGPIMDEADDLSIHYIGSINAIGNNYYYNNYSWLLGFTKNAEGKHVSFGFSLMVGELITTVPALHATGVYYMTGPAGNQTTYNSYFTMNSETQNDFSVEIGIHADVKIAQHIFLRAMADLQFSGLSEAGNYEITDVANGNMLYSGAYAIPGFFVSLFNTTVGLGYRF